MDLIATLTTKKYDELRRHIRSGDILLCQGKSPLSGIIQKATGSLWSHVAFILRIDAIDRIMVLESVESIGVRAVALSSYVSDYNGSGRGYEGRILLARHADVRQENMINLSKAAVDLLGYPYDTQEVLRIAARISLNTMGFNQNEKPASPQREYICSEYASICFQSIGVKIDYNSLGFIAPEDFARCPKVSALSYIHTENNAVAETAVTA